LDRRPELRNRLVSDRRPGLASYLYGSWAWGSPGWTWYSSEPWGFTFHYGRWAYAPIGWVWVPGYTWGPAWVNWYWGGGFVGWGPIGFFGAVPFAQFVFISDNDFNCHNVHDHWHNKPPHAGDGITGRLRRRTSSRSRTIPSSG
jgi:hypothetical protein